MPGFHEILFPTNISYGSAGGPGYKTEVVLTDSGQEERIARWGQARRRYNVVYGIRDFAALADLRRFYIGRRGAENGFRFKDWLDYTTAEDGVTAPTEVDEKMVRVGDGLVDGDGTETAFQIVKRYISGAQQIARTIEKPVGNSVLVSLDDVLQGSGYTVNSTNGIVTFDVAPGAGVLVKAGCEFDVPVRFGEGADEALQASIDDFSSGAVLDVPLVEVLTSTPVDEEFYFGGAWKYSTGSNISITQLQGRAHVIEATSAGIEVTLPDMTGQPGGGPHFYLINDGATHAWTLKHFGGATVATVGTGEGYVLVYDSDNDVWFAIGG